MRKFLHTGFIAMILRTVNTLHRFEKNFVAYSISKLHIRYIISLKKYPGHKKTKTCYHDSRSYSLYRSSEVPSGFEPL